MWWRLICVIENDNWLDTITNVTWKLCALKMENDKQFIGHCIRYEFHQEKSAEKHVNQFVLFLGKILYSKVRVSFGLDGLKIMIWNDRECSDTPKKVIDDKLQAWMRTEWELISNAKGTCRTTWSNSTISNWLRQMWKIRKEGKWVPHAFSQQNKNDRIEKYLNLCNKQHKKSLLRKIVTNDEKWIYCDNFKKRKH